MKLHKLAPVKKLKDWVLVGGLKFLVFIFKSLPFDIALWLAKALSRVIYYLAVKERKKALAHLDIAFPYLPWSKKRRIAKQCFVNLGVGFVEAIRQQQIFSNPEKFIRFEGLEELKRAHGEGKGVIVVSAHLGNWELLAAATARSGFPVTVVARDVEPKGINQLLLDYRGLSSVRSVLRDRPDAARELLRALKNGHVLGILIDQDTKKIAGEFVSFFGKLAYTPIGAAALARISDAPVFLGLSWRDGGKLVFHYEPVELDRFRHLSNRDFDMALTQNLAEKAEGFIRKFPEQWVWMHERWKHRPDGTRWLPYRELPKCSTFLFIRILEMIERFFGKKRLDRAELAGARLGRLMFRLLAGRRKIAFDNLTKAFGDMDEKRAWQVIKSVFENFGMNAALYLRTGARPEDVFENFEVEGWERLERLVSKGRGVLAVGSHMGSFDLGAWWVAQKLPASIVVKKIKNKTVQCESERIRGQFGLKTIYHRGTLQQILERLECGEVVIMVLDQHAPARIATWVNFFNRPASTLTSAALIAAKAGAPVIVGFSLRLGAGKYKLVFGDTFEPPELDDESITAATQQYTLAIENAIRAHPEQWFWLHRRWKSRPPA